MSLSLCVLGLTTGTPGTDHHVFIFFDNDDQTFAVDNALSLAEVTRDGR